LSETHGEKTPAHDETAPAPVVQSFNEWDPLEEVIVGTVRGAVYPEYGPILAAAGEPEWLWHYQGVLVEEEFVRAADEQLTRLVLLLKSEGVTVRRPDPLPLNVGFSTPYWQCRGGWNTANPRDLFLVVGDQIIECASPMRNRHFESLAYRRLFTEYFRAGTRLTAAPRPALREQLYDFNCRATGPHGEADLGKRVRPEGASHRYPISEHEPVWEAADFVRCGRDLFVTRSIVTNELGIEWVRRHLGPDFRVHEIKTRCSTPCHIDTTFVPLAPGKVLVNPDWVTELPECVRNWDVLVAPRPTYLPGSPMSFPQFTSQWLSMNVLSLDHERVLVDVQQAELIRKLREWGFRPIPLPFDHVGPFGGSFHCATLDVRRRGRLESYF
jgi:glycine amidinotransferase